MIQKYNDDIFTIEHLSEDINLSEFIVSKGYGLEYYLKNQALPEEKEGISRTYIIRSTVTDELVAYFTLRSGLITVSRGFGKGFDTYTGIELANFAVNDNFNKANVDIPKLGSYVFAEFILPLVTEISKYVGAAYLYIFALPESKLMSHYETMGFSKTTEKMARYVYRHVKPYYDKGCKFMYQKL